MGTPPEIYNYGTQYWIIVVPILLQYFIIAYIYLPVFWNLQVGSSNEVGFSNLNYNYFLKIYNFPNFIFVVLGTALSFKYSDYSIDCIYSGCGMFLLISKTTFLNF